MENQELFPVPKKGGLLMNPQALNAADHFSAQDVRSQLDRIVSSASFRNSQRLCKFLKFLVDKWAAGSAHDELKERIVGIEVFGRQANYDLSADPVVRVAAVSSGPSTLICIGDLNFLMNPGQDSDELPVNRLMAIRDHVGRTTCALWAELPECLAARKGPFLSCWRTTQI